MQNRNVLFTWQAIYDVTDIAEYIETEFGIDRADKFQNELKKQTDLLDSTNVIFRKIQFYYRNYPIHQKPFFPSIIFYIVTEHEIHILRVLREERDWKTILKRENHYTYPS